MKNTLGDLNNYLFEQIERLQSDELEGESFEKEIKRTEAISKAAKNIIDNANLALNAQKHFDELGVDRTVEIPLLGLTSKNILTENHNLRKRLKKKEDGYE